MKKHLPRLRELQPFFHRTAYLEQYGLLVIRFRNWDVKTRFGAVCKRIDAVVRERVEAE